MNKLNSLLKTILIIIAFSSGVFSQQIWIEATENVDNQIDLRDHFSDFKYSFETAEWLNYNPIVSIDESISIDLELDLASCNIFTIYQTYKNSSENAIWAFDKQSKEQLVLTDQRLADFHSGKYMNFLHHVPGEPQINNYAHQQSSFNADKLVIADLQFEKTIPLNQTSLFLAELIVFDRTLAPLAKSILETGLALKYSIPLEKTVDYINQNEIIWDGIENLDYSSRVAGITRMDQCKVYQKQSKSTFGKGFIAIGLEKIYSSNVDNKSIIEDQAFLIWGDDNGPIDFSEYASNTELLQRSWKIRQKGILDTLVIQIESEILEKEVENKTIYAAVMDFGKPGNLSDLCVYPLQFDDQFSTDILFPFEEQALQIFKAPAKWAITQEINPSCSGKNDGSVEIKPIGFSGNIDLKLISNQGTVTCIEDQLGLDVSRFSNLEAGHYEIQIIQDEVIVWTRSIILNPSDWSEPNVESYYYLGQTSFIDASKFMPTQLEYEWKLPDGSTVYGPALELKQPGKYYLAISNNSCQSYHQFEVLEIKSNIDFMAISPNPSINGYFNLEVILDKASPYSISIYSIEGQLLFNQSYEARRYISFDQQIAQSGIYLVQIQSGKSIETRKLVIQK